MIIFGICMAVLLVVIVIINLVIQGIGMCKKNDALGIFLLFLGLNVFGLILGIGLLYNAKNGAYTITKQKIIDNEINCKKKNFKNKNIEIVKTI